MPRLPVIKDRRTSKIICLAFLAMAVLLLIIGGIYAIIGESVIASVLCFLAAIVGAFSLIYGVSWYISARHENKRQKNIERAAALLAEEDDGSVEYGDFILPHRALTEAARKRFRKFTAAFVIAVLVIFNILYIFLLLSIGYSGVRHLVSVAVFCFLITLPGLAVQLAIYRKYEKSVPHRIMLFPGKLIVDEKQFMTREITKITISSYKSANRNGTSIYRKLRIKTNRRTFEYTIDFRDFSDGNPHWENYGVLLEAIQKWAKQNRTEITVDYMN